MLFRSFEINYQEVIDFKINKVVAIEPRLSWTHNGEQLNHAQVSSLAEQYQLTLHLDAYVFAHINQLYPCLKNSYGDQTTMHLPISSQHLKNKYGMRNLKNTINQSKIDLTKLHLFFNEKALVQDLESHINAFEVITDYGIKVGISGYGAGYSALANLSYLPLTSLKLDDAICQKATNQQQLNLMKSYLLSGQALGFEIFTAGVNNAEQKQQLTQLGYRYGQGTACQKAREKEVCKPQVS